jgi:hypothetical protein
MFLNWWERKDSPRANRKQSSEPRTRPPLEPCPAPAEPGPESGSDIPDLRAALLELTADRARLRRNQSLFQKETERFESVLEPLPAWLVAMYNLTPARRRDNALYWAKRLQLTREYKGGERLWLDLTELGRGWLIRRLEEQYAFVYRALRDTEQPSESYHYWGHEFDDGWFLGAPFSSVPVPRGDRGAEVWATPLTLEQRQPLREALHAAFTELPIGVFHRLDNFTSHVSFGPHNPLLLGRRPDEVRVRMSGRTWMPRDEPLYEAARQLLGQFVSNRLVSLGCLQAGRDAEGELLIARRPRLDVYFGHAAADESSAAAGDTRVIVQPDFSVLVIGLDQSPLAELLPFCERIRERSSAGAASLRITRSSIVKAAVTGLSSADILERLQRHGRTPLPSNVVHEVREWADWVRTASAEPATLVRCPDALAADRVAAALGRQAEKLNETTVALSSASLSDSERRKLLEQGIVVKGP